MSAEKLTPWHVGLFNVSQFSVLQLLGITVLGCVEHIQEDSMNRSKTVLIKWFQSHKSTYLKCFLWHGHEIWALKSAGFIPQVGFFSWYKHYGLLALRPLQAIRTLLHISKFKIWTPLGLPGNQKLLVFREVRYEQQNNELVLKHMLSYTRCAKHFIREQRRKALQTGNKLLLLYNCY